MTPRAWRLLKLAAVLLVAAAISNGLYFARRPGLRPPKYRIPVTQRPEFGARLEGMAGQGLKRGVLFQDVTEQAGIRFQHFFGRRASVIAEDMGSGAAWGDYDNDGDLDLYLVNMVGSIFLKGPQKEMSPARNALYRYNGDGTFTDVAPQAGVDHQGWDMAAAWGDYDNDGDLDLYVTQNGPNLLYRNNGDGTFTDVTKRAGVGDPRFSAGCAWGDYDRDGDLDLYVTNYVEFIFREKDRREFASYRMAGGERTSLDPSHYEGQPNSFYRNNGDSTFTDVAPELGVDDPDGRGLGCTWADFDADGWLDLYVANDASPNKLYCNLHNGRFEDVSFSSHSDDGRASMGVAVGDPDNDGDFDLYITNWYMQGNAMLINQRTEDAQVGRPPRLSFVDEGHSNREGFVSMPYIGWGTAFFDYDNDGWADLFVNNGSTLEDEQQPHLMLPMLKLLLENQGDRRFMEVANAGEATPRRDVGRGAAFADYDDDGDTDIVLVAHSGPATLLRNEVGQRNHWLKLRLRQPRHNRYALGTLVKVTAGGLTQMQQVGAGAPYLSQNSTDLLFGLGAATQAERIEITWPGGQKQTLRQVAADQMLVIEREEGGSGSR